MEHARPPAELVLEGGPACRADAWRKWYKQFCVFLKASGVGKETKEVQASLLINLIGPDGYDIYSTFKFLKDENQDDIDVLVRKFNTHFGSKQNTTMARFRFFTRNQEIGENVDTYVTALRLLCQHCEFEHLEEGLIRDRIVCGVADGAVRDRLLRTDDLTLEKTIKICQANEISHEENKQIEVAKSSEGFSGSGVAVDAVYGTRGIRRAPGGAAGQAGARLVARGRGAAAATARDGSRGAPGPSRRLEPRYCDRDAKCCDACGNNHSCDYQCPAKLTKCFLCGKKGHFKKMCPLRFGKQVYELREEDETDELFYVSTLESCSRDNHNKWYETLILCKNYKTEKFKLDSGSDLNVLSFSTLKYLGYSLSDLTPCDIRAQSFCGNYLCILGSIEMLWLYKNERYFIKFVITKDNCQSVLGKYSCENLGMIKRLFSIDIDTFNDLFQGVGKLPGKYKIIIDKNACPSVCPVRKIPVGIRDKLKSELDHMEQIGVIRKVSHPTAWVNAIVLPVKKDGGVRVCLDPRPLNRAVRRAHYPLPTLTDIAAKLHGARYFSKLDARSGFWMIQLDDESADLCTFGTPFGRYQFLRLPYGISCASEVFHAKITQILEDLEGVHSFIDDIIIHGRTREEHDARLRRVLERAREVGIRFNRDKCEFCVERVTYLGHTFSRMGMQIETNKLRAIADMPSPNDRASLERFLGMTNYLSKFIPNYANIVTPLRCLLKKGTEWSWDSVHEGVVSQLKGALCGAPVLALYSATEPVLLTVDASARALGAALLQAGRPVEFASLTLTDTQSRYAQIEKEMLAIVFALERFHQYVYGRSDVTVETDHKPLEVLFKKPLDAVPARLQRMMLRIQCYSFSVVYKPGKYMYVADALSRAALPELMHDKLSTEVEAQSCFLINNVQFSDSKIQRVRDETHSDKECKIIIEYVLRGWPRYRRDTHELVQCHWSYRQSFEYIDGILFKDNLVFIPRKLRKEMLSRVHEGHLGIDRCKRRARDVMFWSGMSRDVERTVRACAACAEHAAMPSREPMISHAVPSLPWRKVGSDIFVFQKKYFLILVDYFSNFIEVNLLSSIGSRAVILAMKDQFARYGIPLELITDNGPAYSSKEFKEFCTEWGFIHTTTSPNYAQANGLSERAVQTVKNIIKKSITSGSDIYLGLLNLRSTPRDGVSSPAQLLMGRRLNTRLPINVKKLQPERNNSKDYANIIRNRNRNKRYYDSRSTNLGELKPGERVIVVDSDGKNRRRMQVHAPAPQPRSYFLTDESGRKYRRNRRHIIRAESDVHRSPSIFTEGKENGDDDAECTSLYDDAEELEMMMQSAGPSGIYGESPRSLNVSPKESDKALPRLAAHKAREKLALFFKKT